MLEGRKAASLIALIVVVLFAGDRLLYWTGIAAISRSSERFIRAYNHRSERSVLIVGNSRADNHFPMQKLTAKLGLPVVNLGLGGEATVISELLVRDYLERNEPPALVVIEVSNAIEDPREIGDFGFLANYSHRFSELRRQDSPSFSRWASIFKLLDLNSPELFRALYGLFHHEGDRLFFRQVTPEALESLRSRQLSKPQSRLENLAALTRLNELSKSHGIPIRFVLSPYLILSSTRTEQTKAWASELEARIGGGVKIADYSDLVTDPTCFMDSLHLNTKGVDLYMKRLVDDGILSP